MSAPALSGRCEICGARMFRSWLRDGMEMSEWLDERGSVLGGGPSAAETLDDLRRQFADRPALRTSDLRMQIYSLALVAVGQGVGMPWQHVHRVRLQPYAGEVPECCAWPMRLVRDGWACRVAGHHARAGDAA